MSTLEENPFFIIGHPRSGTTLLRFMLASHSRIYIPEETGFLPHLLKPVRFHAPMSRAEIEKCIDKIGKLNYLWRGLVDNPEEFYNSLQEPTLPYLIDALYRVQIAPFNARRWGDKTPLYIQYIEQLSHLFPKSQFIHVIRDGRDAALSARRKWQVQRPYQDFYYLIYNWARNVNIGRQAGLALGSTRYIEIFYEELVDNPVEILMSLCKFLNEDFETAMLDHTQLARQVGPGPDHHTEVLDPIRRDRTQQWQIQLTRSEKITADLVAGGLLEELGYQKERAGKFTPKDSLVYHFSKARFFLLDAIRTGLYATGLLTLNRNMRKK
jgi:hypothetical protein